MQLHPGSDHTDKDVGFIDEFEDIGTWFVVLPEAR